MRTPILHKNYLPPMACLANTNDGFKASLYFFVPPNPINMTTVTRQYAEFPTTTSPTRQTFLSGYSFASLERIKM